MTILDKIIANKKMELSSLKRSTSLDVLEKSKFFTRNTISLGESILNGGKTGIIAEFKRKSPSKGIINSHASAVDVAAGYFREGASGVSVLTDSKYFGGSSADLTAVRENNLFPVLRKDFIIDEYQVIESKAIGADAILLIASVLNKKEIFDMSHLARSIGLEVLLEIHEQNELEMVNQYVNFIGVNNRNLKTFEVDIHTSEEIAGKIPGDFLKISESGISSPAVIKILRQCGYNGFLIGESFMCTPDPVKAFSGFVKEII